MKVIFSHSFNNFDIVLIENVSEKDFRLISCSHCVVMHSRAGLSWQLCFKCSEDDPCCSIISTTVWENSWKYFWWLRPSGNTWILSCWTWFVQISYIVFFHMKSSPASCTFLSILNKIFASFSHFAQSVFNGSSDFKKRKSHSHHKQIKKIKNCSVFPWKCWRTSFSPESCLQVHLAPTWR